MTIHEIHELFCAHLFELRGYSPKTITGHKEALRLFLSVHPNVALLEDVTFAVAEQFFIHGRQVRGWKPSTFHTYHKRLNAFFAWTTERGLSVGNPIARVDKPKLGRPLPRALRASEAMTLIDVAGTGSGRSSFVALRNRTVVALFVHTGLRKHELLALRMQDVCLRKQVVRVARGKGRVARTIPLSETALAMLRHYLARREALPTFVDNLFVCERSGAAISAQVLKRLRNDLVQKTGISFGWHRLRHTFATLMVEGGCDIYALAEMMGHTDISTTALYLRASARHLHQEIRKHPFNWDRPTRTPIDNSWMEELSLHSPDKRQSHWS